MSTVHCHTCELEVEGAGPWCTLYARFKMCAGRYERVERCDGIHHRDWLIIVSSDGEYSCLGCGVVLV